MPKKSNPVVNYYHSWESLLGYRKLKGVKHFGYYPKGKGHISKAEAQLLMDKQLAKTLGLPAGNKVLDAGCGEGGVTFFLAQQYGLRVEGIDLLDFNIARAKRRGHQLQLEGNVSFQVGSYQELPFKANSFDGVYTLETLVHSPDYHKALKEFYRVLKPGGRLVLFEYSIKPDSQLSSDERRGMQRIKYVNDIASMPAFNEFTWGSMPEKLAVAGFQNVVLKDITERMFPMLRQFADVARGPYKVARFLHLQKHVINAMSAVELWDNRDLLQYNIITANK